VGDHRIEERVGQMVAPRLYHSGIATFMGAAQCSLENLQSGAFAVVGVPYDYASGSRPGARWGPRAIRQSSLYFDYFLHSGPDQDYVHVETGKEFHFKEDGDIVDLGDVELYPMDVERTMETISDFIQQVIEKKATPIVLGGDHFITYPCFCGYARGVNGVAGPKKTGYIHVDAHFDMFDNHPAWGRFYHGSTVRRIAESDLIDPSNILLIGVQGLLRKEAYEFLQRNHTKIITLKELRSQGVGTTVRRVVEQLAMKVEHIYLSVDIDAVSSAFAPGTGGITFDGVTDGQLLEMIDVLKEFPIGAFDVVEVAPNYDLSERTQRLAAQILFDFIMHKVTGIR